MIGVLDGTYHFHPHLAIDGIFGRQTLLAVIAAQKAFKLDADSLVGIQTWRKLLE
jgi:peptidoglycan hydrolase-like protein with peptidoglycan-binding domain